MNYKQLKVAIPQQTLSLLYKTKGQPDWIKKKYIQLVEELFSSLREAGSWQGSASNLVVLSSRQTKVAISGHQLSSLINLLDLKKRKTKTKEDRRWKAIPPTSIPLLKLAGCLKVYFLKTVEEKENTIKNLSSLVDYY